MARLLVHSEWYSAIDAPDIYETEFESLIFSRGNVLFPGYIAVPFKTLVAAESGSARADYALIDCNYRTWWVVEVELTSHSLHGHVIPQVGVLSTARYGRDEARLLCARDARLDEARVTAVMKGLPPQILVVIERPMPDWEFILKRYGIRVAIFEIFKSERDRLVFRVNGYIPSAGSEALSDCWLDPGMPALVRIAAPGALGLGTATGIELEFDGRMTDWDVLASGGAVWLVAKSRNPLARGVRYEISSRADGKNVLRCILGARGPDL